ncbi:Glutaredoxin-1 [Halotydeus destructor]|nr:Glutaredoxin-1 [Halotydeus destructor]
MGSILGKSVQVMVSEDVKIFVDTTLKTKKVVVFSKTYCPYARKAKSILAGYPIEKSKIEIIELEKRPDCAEIQSYMRDLTGANTVPRVFIDGTCIGGGDDTQRLHETGELKKMLQDLGVLV